MRLSSEGSNASIRLHKTQGYWVEEAEAPFRCRLQKRGLKFSRDIAKWEKRRDLAGKSTMAAEGLDPVTTSVKKVENTELHLPRSSNEERDNHENGNGEDGCGEDAAGFFAFPVVVHSSHAHHVVSVVPGRRGYLISWTCRVRCAVNADRRHRSPPESRAAKVPGNML